MKRLIASTGFLSVLIITLLFSGCEKTEDITPPLVNNPSIPVDSDTTVQHKILILMYHKLTDDVPADIYQRNSTDFENDLLYIKSKNYEVISFDDIIEIKEGKKELKTDAVIISFDDGYASDYMIAYPKLKVMKMPATFFVVTEWVGQADRITWGNAWEMDQFRSDSVKKLFSIESHSSSHPFLMSDSSTFANHDAYQTSLNAEIGDSKAWIQNVTGQSSMWLALPYGDGANNELIISTAKRYGYSGIRTSLYGSFTIKTMNLFALPSLPILSTTSIFDIDNYLD